MWCTTGLRSWFPFPAPAASHELVSAGPRLSSPGMAQIHWDSSPQWPYWGSSFYTEFCNTPVLPVCGHGYCYWISGISVRGSTMWVKVGNCGGSARCSTTPNSHQRISSFLFHLQEVLGILRILQQMSTNPQSTVWKRNLRVGGIPVGNNLLYNHQWTAGCFLLSSCRPPFLLWSGGYFFLPPEFDNYWITPENGGTLS